jgi:hypothetical protein
MALHPAPGTPGSILPDILDVAREHGVALGRQLSHRPEEIRADCPFCSDTKKHLYLNTEKHTFKCFRCGEKGGVIDFLSLLSGQSKTQVLEEIKEELRSSSPVQKRKKKKIHPARRLNTFQLQQIGYSHRPNWQKFFKEEPIAAKEYADAIWENWQAFVEYEKMQAMKILLLCLHAGRYQKGVEFVRERSKEIGHDLLTPCLKEYSNECPPKWVKEAKKLARLWLE